MDLRIFVAGLIICLQSIVSLTTAVSGYNCRLCKPGFYASRMCSSDHDTVCKPCSFGTFSPEPNVLTNCQTCSNCNVGEFIVEECSKSSDTKCAPCDSIKESFSHHFRTECLQTNESRINISASEGITLHENSKEDIDLYESSSVPEGSGVLDSSETVHIPIFPLVNVTTEEEEDKLEQGSGEVSVIENTTESESNGTTIKPVILPDDETDSDKITETTTVNVTQTTTVRTGVIVPIDGIDLDTETERPQIDVVVDDVTVYVTEDKAEDDNQPKTGASQKQDTRDDSGGASVGVVVTVGLVTAFVFFVLGFLASRVWNGRRERTFNVLEAERRNGKPPVECSGIEYKDPENNITKPGRVYDEKPAKPKANGSGAEPKPANANPNTASAPPIYTKPIKRSTEQPTASQPKQTVPPPKTDSKSERPASEIKYIDEGSGDEEETDKLLPTPTTPSGNDTTSGETSRSDNASGENQSARRADDEKVGEPDTSNENTPMLPNEANHRDS